MDCEIKSMGQIVVFTSVIKFDIEIEVGKYGNLWKNKRNEQEGLKPDYSGDDTFVQTTGVMRLPVHDIS